MNLLINSIREKNFSSYTNKNFKILTMSDNILNNIELSINKKWDILPNEVKNEKIYEFINKTYDNHLIKIQMIKQIENNNQIEIIYDKTEIKEIKFI